MRNLCRLVLFFSLLLPSSTLFAQDEGIPDPLEPVNRRIFWFNDKLDVYVFEPVAIGYDFITPQKVQSSVGNFFDNLDYPIYLASDLMQLNFTQATKDTSRFLVNTLVGFYGFFDVADKIFGLEPVEDDFNVAFARWGIPSGPYLVLPILGSSSLRDTVGFVGESFISPTMGLTYGNVDNSTSNLIIGGGNSLKYINLRSRLLEPVRSAKEATLDYYTFMKNSYYQRNYSRIHGEMPPSKDPGFEDELDMGFEDEMEFEDELDNSN